MTITALAFVVWCCACYLTADHRVKRVRWVVDSQDLEKWLDEVKFDPNAEPLHIECKRIIEWVHPDE